jgi:hypothetical protein
VIVADTTAHVHIGCTFGDFPLPVTLDSGGRFEAAGSYLLRAYPVAVGPTLPARFTGALAGVTLTLSVAVDVTYGKEPRLGPCPICRKPRATR